MVGREGERGVYVKRATVSKRRPAPLPSSSPHKPLRTSVPARDHILCEGS